MTIGDNFIVNTNSSIVCMDKITIGEGCLISWDCLLMDSDFHNIYDRNDPLKTQQNQDAEISIGSNVWIGCQTMVLKGIAIPNNVVIGACSLITGRLPEKNAVYAGSMILRRNIEWTR